MSRPLNALLLGLALTTLNACYSPTAPIGPDEARHPELEALGVDAQNSDLALVRRAFRPLGDAQLEWAPDGSLSVSNIGSSGRDGVMTKLPGDVRDLERSRFLLEPISLQEASMSHSLNDLPGTEPELTLRAETRAQGIIAVELDAGRRFSQGGQMDLFRDGQLVATTTWMDAPELADKEIRIWGDPHVNVVGTTARGLVLNLSLGWHDALVVRWSDGSGDGVQQVMADRMVFRIGCVAPSQPAEFLRVQELRFVPTTGADRMEFRVRNAWMTGPDVDDQRDGVGTPRGMGAF